MLPTFDFDTDSLFVMLGEWIKDQGYEKEFNDLPDEEKIKWIKLISKTIEGYIDKRIYEEVQLKEYNSQVHDFKIGFKQEIIAKTSLFVKKKKYCYWLVDKEGVPKDEISVTGLELVRSDSSEAVRPRLKHIMELIMKKRPEKEIYEYTQKYVQELKKLEPADLAANIGINGLKKYLHKGEAKKGTPWHVKGAYNYRKLLKALGIENKYEDIYEGLKAKVVYVMKNPFNVDTVSFHIWPEEFNQVLQYDPDMMIEKFFINKIRFLLEPMGKEHIIDNNDSKLDSFF